MRWSLALILLLFFATPVGAQSHEDQFVIASLAEIKHLTTRGDYLHLEWSASAEANLTDAVVRIGHDYGVGIAALDPGCSERRSNGQSILLASIISATAAETIPHRRIDERYEGLTLGPEAMRDMQICQPFTSLIVISHDGRVVSSGTLIAGTAAAVLTGFQADRDASDTTRLSVFDAETGDLVYHARVSNGDPRTEGGALSIARSLIEQSEVFDETP